MEYDQQALEVYKTALDSGSNNPIMAAIGVRNGVVNQVKRLVDNGCNIIVIDVAHGHHKLVGDLLCKLIALNLKAKDNLPVEYIAGNVATVEGGQYLLEAGADAIKVGIGSGSICSTRIVTGHGVPQLTAIAKIALMATYYNRPIIADGGFKTSGDIVKALAAGANTIMTGFILAGTNECPQKSHTNSGDQAVYRGMASKDSQQEFYGNAPDAPEGVVAQIRHKGPVEKVMRNLIASLQSGLSYSGVQNLEELRARAQWSRISQNSYMESLTI
jgi:IMP dehydrogenase